MKTVVNILAALLFISNMAFAQQKWSVDPAHSNVRFEVNHLGISVVDGQFKNIQGVLESKNDSDFNQASVSFNIDVNSIDTRIEMRDKHLLSDDFFSAAQYPSISLKNAVLKAKENGYTLTGDLTIRDVTKKVSFQVKQNSETITDPWGKTRAGFTAKTSINRFDFGINYADKLPSGVFAVSPEVDIIVNVEIVKD